MDRHGNRRKYWTFQIIVEQNDGKVVKQVPWTYTYEFTLHKDGKVTVSFIDAEQAAALDKALAGKKRQRAEGAREPRLPLRLESGCP
jgi:hypothetical protein